MPTRKLPLEPRLDALKEEARRLLRDSAAGNPQACQRWREFHPRLSGFADDAIAAAPLRWGDALLAIAREYGFASWPRLKRDVEGPRDPGAARPHHERIEDPLFRHAVDLLDDGDADALAALLSDQPDLARRHVVFEGENYFRNPSLLGFVAENPVRHDSLPPNIIDITRIILEAGAREDRAALNETLALVASGRVPRENGVQLDLIDLLVSYEADPAGAVHPALGHGEFDAAGRLLHHGAPLSLAVAAALGRTGEARTLLASATPDERHRALAQACQHGHVGIAGLLLDAGENADRYNPVGLHSHATPLHQAVWAGHEEVVRLLMERGARLDLRDTIHQGTPLDWAQYGGQAALAAYLREERERRGEN